jgi:RNA polymerase primary sigma factor
MKSDISDYANEVGNFQVLTPEQNAELSHTPEAQNKLVEANLRLAIHWAKKFAAVSRIRVELEDLIQEGNIGLMIAARKFNSRKGMFSTYASYWIKQRIMRFIEEHTDLVQGPGWSIRRLVHRWKENAERLRHELRREPTPKEIQARLKLGKSRLRLVRIALRMKSVLDMSQMEDDAEEKASAGIEQYADPKTADSPGHLLNGELSKDELQKMFDNAAVVLSTQESDIFDRRFLREQTFEDIGRDLGFTRQRADQIAKNAVRKLALYKKWQTAEAGPLAH